LLAASTTPAHTIVVPSDQPTIQQGIHASVDGDTVLVMPGTYLENILIDGDIAVRSAGGPAVTIIDGSQPANPDSGSVVRFYVNGSIEGFDIRNGSGTGGGDRRGGGVFVDNWDDPGTEYGPLIMDCWIHGNWLESSQSLGAGIQVTGSARIIGSRIFDNGIHGDGTGAAIFGFSAIEPTLFQDNEVYDNHTLPSTPGLMMGAVVILEGAATGNVIACNTGGRGTGLIGAGLIESNTIAGNWSFTEEPSVILGTSENCWGPVTFQNNNVTDNHGPSVECLECDQGDPIFLGCNNIFGNVPGGQVIGICADVIGQDGNVSVAPLYGRTGCEPGQGYWCLGESSPLLIDPPPGCGLIGALGLCPPIGIRDTEPVAPRHLRVSAPRPNPFTSRTTVPFYLAEDSEVEVQIYDVLGRRIRTLAAGCLVTGDHVLEWDGRIESGSRAASGAYVARIRAGGEELTRTLLLIR
jgi:hypothetical protein